MKTLGIVVCVAGSLFGQVTYQRLLEADREPGNWLTYSGNYASLRHSRLQQIRRDNVGQLKLKWAFQMKTTERVQATPLVVDGIMYLTQPPNDVVGAGYRNRPSLLALPPQFSRSGSTRAAAR